MIFITSLNMENVLNFLKSVLYGLFVWLGIKTGTVKILFYLMVIDSLLGIAKALVLGERFSFKRLGWGMVSKLSLLFIPMILALIAKGLNLEFNLFVIAAMNILIVNEGISCITNILSIKTKKHIQNNDYVTLMLNSIKNLLSGLIQRFLEVIEQDKNNNKTE